MEEEIKLKKPNLSKMTILLLLLAINGEFYSCFVFVVRFQCSRHLTGFTIVMKHDFARLTSQIHLVHFASAQVGGAKYFASLNLTSRVAEKRVIKSQIGSKYWLIRTK